MSAPNPSASNSISVREQLQICPHVKLLRQLQICPLRERQTPNMSAEHSIFVRLKCSKSVRIFDASI